MLRGLVFAALALTLPLERAGIAASAEPAAVVLVSPGPEAYRAASEAARQLIAERGGRVELLPLDGADAERRAAARLAGSDDIAVAVGARAARFVRASAPNSRLVYAMVLDPGSLGLPGPGDAPRRGLTGVTMDVDPGAQLDMLRLLAPSATRIGVLYDPEISGDAVRQARAVAKAKGFQVIAQAVRGEGEVIPAANVLLPSVDALWGIADPTVFTAANARALILLAMRSRKPLLALSEGFVRTGALAALAADPVEVGRAAGLLALELARGDGATAPPALPPPRLDLFLNRATAEHIGLTVPSQLVAKASAVFPTP
jgi:putative ABC transport system substrate-binding protein